MNIRILQRTHDKDTVYLLCHNQECLAVSYQEHFIKTLPVFSPSCSRMEEQEEKDLWIAVWVFSGQFREKSDDIKYLNIFPGDKIVSLREDEVRPRTTNIIHHIDVVIAVTGGFLHCFFFIRTGSTDI